MLWEQLRWLNLNSTLLQIQRLPAGWKPSATPRSVDGKGRYASLDTLRIAFFLHVYHENLEHGGVSSLSYLREAITLAQIMGLHRESTYIGLSTSQQESRRRILWLLFVTERYVPFVDQRLVTDLAKRGCNAS
jgi:hypothetical protein